MRRGAMSSRLLSQLEQTKETDNLCQANSAWNAWCIMFSRLMGSDSLRRLKLPRPLGGRVSPSWWLLCSTKRQGKY